MAEKKIRSRAEPKQRMSQNQLPNQKKGGVQRESESKLLVTNESKAQGTKKSDVVVKRNIDVMRRRGAGKRSSAATRVTTSRGSKTTTPREPPNNRRGDPSSRTVLYLFCFRERTQDSRVSRIQTSLTTR